MSPISTVFTPGTQVKAGLRALLLGCLVLGGTLATTGCESEAIGRTCRTLVENSTTDKQAVFNDEALECPTRLCIKPAKQVGTATNTGPFCSAECNSKKDCDDTEGRDPKNSADKRCTSGFTCGIAFEVGPLACKKLCLCKDFVEDEVPTPVACLGTENK